MTLFQIAVSNIKRRKMKMLFPLLGLMLGVSAVVSMLGIVSGMELELGDRMDEFGANAIILPRSQGIEIGHAGAAFDIKTLTMEDIPLIYTSEVTEYLNIISPKLIGAVETDGGLVLLAGINPMAEFTQKPWLTLYRQIGVEAGRETEDLALLTLPPDGILLGYTASKALAAEPGDTIQLNGKPYNVFGILKRTGGEEDGLIYADLTAVQQLLDRPGELSMIEVSAYCNFCPIEEIAAGIDAVLPWGRTIPLRQAALFREESIERFSAFGYVLSALVLAIAGLVVLTTMLSAVHERTREIGILRAVGFRSGHILRIILLEVLMISFVGGILGFAAGSLMASTLGPFLAQLQGAVPYRFDLLVPAVLLANLVAVAAGLIPAFKAARLDPAQALRFI